MRIYKNQKKTKRFLSIDEAINKLYKLKTKEVSQESRLNEIYFTLMCLQKTLVLNNIDINSINVYFPKRSELVKLNVDLECHQYDYILIKPCLNNPIEDSKCSHIYKTILQGGIRRFYLDSNSELSLEIGQKIEDLNLSLLNLMRAAFIQKPPVINLNILDRFKTVIYQMRSKFFNRFEDHSQFMKIDLPIIRFTRNRNFLLIESVNPSHRAFGKNAGKLNLEHIEFLITNEDFELANYLVILNELDNSYMNFNQLPTLLTDIDEYYSNPSDTENQSNLWTTTLRKHKIKNLIKE